MPKKFSPEELIAASSAKRVEVLACPGSGKTRTLVQRLHHLCHVAKVPVNKVLVLSFSNAAVGELQKRIAKQNLSLLEGPSQRGKLKSNRPNGRQLPLPTSPAELPDLSAVSVQTAHGYAYGLIRGNGRACPLEVLNDTDVLVGTTILNAERDVQRRKLWTHKSQKTIAHRLEQLELLAQPPYLKRISGLFDVARASKVELATAIKFGQFEELQPYLKALEFIHIGYAKIKKKKRVIDFSDMLDEAVKIIAKDPAVVPFTHFLVDEYQDCSMAQTHLLAQLAALPIKTPRQSGPTPPPTTIATTRSIMVFGDQNQAIFGFTGSSYTPLSPVLGHVVKLSLPYSWRLTAPTAALASAVAQLPAEGAIQTKRDGTPPVLIVNKSLTAQTKRIVSDIQRLIDSGVDRRQIVVLARVKSSLAPVESALLANNIGTQRKGLKRERDKVHPLRVLRLVRRVERSVASGRSIDSATVRRALSNLTGVTEDGWWKKAVASLRLAMKVQSLDGRYKLCSASYLRLLGGVRRDAELRADVNRWIAYCRSYGSASAAIKAIKAMETAAVITSTIHAAKGGEWNHVFIVGATDGLLPIHFVRNQRMIAEERNLMYVAITRARESVRLYHAPTHITRTGKLASHVSRFIDEPAVRTTLSKVDRN